MSKNLHPNLGYDLNLQKQRTIRFPKWNWLSKSNLNYNYCSLDSRVNRVDFLNINRVDFFNLNLRSRRNPCFKMSKNLHPNLGYDLNLQKQRTIRFPKWNWLSKSNLNYNYCKGYDQITLLTWLKWRFGFNLRWLKSIS